MGVNVSSIKCPNCGASVDLDTEFCPYCGSRLVITSTRDMDSMSPALLDKTIRSFISSNADTNNEKVALTMGLCHFKLGNYDNAIRLFDGLTNGFVNNPDIYYYSAIAMLKGKKAFLCPRGDIDKAVNYLETALSYEGKPQYYYLLAYIKYDFFQRKAYKQEKDYRYYLSMAEETGLDNNIKNELYDLLKVTKPDIL